MMLTTTLRTRVRKVAVRGPWRRFAVAGLTLAAALCAGCGGRYVTRTEYIAPGFTKAALRGRTVAVVPPADGPASAAAAADAGELAGVVRGLREAGARVRVLPPPGTADAPLPEAAAADPVTASHPAPPYQPVALMADFADPYSDAASEAARRWGRAADSRYLLVVRVTDGGVFHEYARRKKSDGADLSHLAGRTTGLRLGLRLALVRLADASTLWVASGTGEARAERLHGPAGGATADDDLKAGNAPLYPPPPSPQAVAASLTRRLLARVPNPTELEPN